MLLTRNCLFFCIFFLFITDAIAGTITGTVRDHEGNILPYASIAVKGTSKGSIANSQGQYSLTLDPGTYILSCQYVGFRPEEKKVIVSAGAMVVDFNLNLQDLTMEEVVIKRGEDPAIEIIRETIKKREFHNKQVDSFTVDVYIKGLMRTRAIPDKFLGTKIDKKELEKEGLDSAGKGIIFLSESLTRVAFKHPDKIKYEVLSSRTSGGGFGFSVPHFINFYTNNVNVMGSNLNPRGFVSPVADNAFHYYNFRYEGNFFQEGKMINQIRVSPKRKNEPLFRGHLYIIDGEWKFHSLDLTTTSDQQLELLDTIQIRQIHAAVAENIWKTQNQVVYLTIKTFGFDITGSFLNAYSNYNLQPGFSPKYFNRVIMSYDTAYNKKDSTYWSNLRPVPLEPDEKKDFAFKDSVYKYERDSMFANSNIDSLRKRRKPVKAGDFLVSGVTRNMYSHQRFSTYRLKPLLQNIEYNTVEGFVVNLDQSLSILPRRGNLNYELTGRSRYGFSNQHFNGSLGIILKPKRDRYRNRFLLLEGGKRVSQFNQNDPIDPFTNSISTLFYRNNWMKIYENWFGKIQYNNRLENGLKFTVTATYEDRIPLQNTADYSFFKKERVFTSNHPYELNEILFEKHQALVTSLSLSFQPGQKYIQFPNSKVAIGSKYPVMELEYSKGIKNLLASDADFDKWKFSVSDRVNMKLKGEFRYRVSAGGFLNKSRVDIPDYQHFIGNKTLFNRNYLNSFQLASYYRYSNIESLYGLAHVEHHFNGLLTNKIPLMNKMKWNLVAGSNTFYVNRDQYYVEVFAGLENIFKIFRVDFVTAYQSAPGNNYGVRVGAGGILGGALR